MPDHERRHVDPHRLPVDPDLLADEEAGAEPLAEPELHHAHPALLATVAAGGVVGAICRYGLGLAFPEPVSGFPLTTFIINATGSLVLGVILVIVAERLPHTRLVRPFLATGVVGAYTTFSTYVVGADLLVRAGHPVTAATYVIASLAAGGVAALAGIVLGTYAVELLPEPRR